MKNNLLLLCCLFVSTVCTNAWSAPLTMYVEQFRVSGAANSGEMKDTIQTLLQSRLAGEHITVVNSSGGADVKVTGSYLMSGANFSLDAVAFNSAGAVITRAYAQGKNLDDLIPSVSALAKSLSDGIVRAIPSINAPLAPPLLNDVVISPPKPVAPIVQQKIFKMDGALEGMSVGRTLPGGDRELFMFGNHSLRYYRQGADLQLLSEINFKMFENLIAVDAVTVGKDNNPEIYVTIINGEQLVSQIWTVDGSSLKQVAGPLPYFFRAITGPGGVKKLYAQQISDREDFFGPIGELVRTAKGYELANPVNVPQPGYVYGFNMVKGAKSGLDYVLFDRSGYLKFFTAAGDEVWKSGEKFGGSDIHFGRIVSGNLTSDGIRQVYLDQRIIEKENGELLVPKNKENWYYPGKHSYSSNNIYCFAWDGVDLSEKWHTGETANYLADFAYDDVAHELLQLEIVNTGEFILSKAASRLVVRKME